MSKDITRELWLGRAAAVLAKRIKKAGWDMPANVRYTCGFPSKGGLAKKKQVIGQAWDMGNSKDQTFEISVSPTQADPLRVLDILLHEMIHVAVGLEHGHKGDFRTCALACGLEGKMTATTASRELVGDMRTLAADLGHYPHGSLEGRANSGPPKQGTRMIKCECERCEYTIRTTKKWIEQGLPTCHCGGEFVSDYKPEEADSDDE